mgnify:CR=1 FL=1
MVKSRNLQVGNTTMLVLSLLTEQDMYGYQMIETLAERSQNVFELQAGTLYPILHTLQKEGFVEAYEQDAGQARVRKYYHITKRGGKNLAEQKKSWKRYSDAIDRVLGENEYAWRAPQSLNQFQS